jgi:hypothetical protein
MGDTLVNPGQTHRLASILVVCLRILRQWLGNIPPWEDIKLQGGSCFTFNVSVRNVFLQMDARSAVLPILRSFKFSGLLLQFFLE